MLAIISSCGKPELFQDIVSKNSSLTVNVNVVFPPINTFVAGGL